MLKFESIEIERKKRFNSLLNEGSGAEEEFITCIKMYANEEVKDRLIATLRFAKGITYSHPGLSPASYFAHPLRVTSMALQLEPVLDEDTFTIALLHNVLEVSETTVDKLRNRFNKRIAESISMLTVDRSQGNDREYKKKYYEKLNTTHDSRIVKALDKIDNLFVLCLNKNDEVRKAYLEEAEKYIIPFIDKDISEISAYVKQLIQNCHEVGYLDIEFKK